MKTTQTKKRVSMTETSEIAAIRKHLAEAGLTLADALHEGIERLKKLQARKMKKISSGVGA